MNLELLVPTGDVVNTIFLRAEFDAGESALRIHGKAKTGLDVFVDVPRSNDKVSLPFVNGSIRLETIGGQGLSRLHLDLLGWEDRRDI
jgi:hypothetical protein